MKPLEFFVFGSGSYAPGSKAKAVRNPAGYALKRGDEVVLFDLGFGNLRQLARLGLSPDDVEAAFFTHRHPDHVGDLAALLFHYRYGGKPRGGRLRLYGPRGFKNFVSRLTQTHHPWLKPRGFTLSVVELEEAGVVRGDGWRVHCREVPHTTEALAYRFESPEGGMCYSGDTAYDPGLAQFARGAELFVLECTFGDRERAEGHLRVSQALELARAAGAGLTLFTHLTSQSERELKRSLPKASALAKDLGRYSIRRLGAGR